jgi:hypothetical protein
LRMLITTIAYLLTPSLIFVQHFFGLYVAITTIA